jgi:two-component response regulator (ARR-B family)
VDEFESTMSNLEHEKLYMETNGNKVKQEPNGNAVKQEPNVEFMDNAKVLIPILPQLSPNTSDLMSVFKE